MPGCLGIKKLTDGEQNGEVKSMCFRKHLKRRFIPEFFKKEQRTSAQIKRVQDKEKSVSECAALSF